jgi:hypothetical protein
MSGAIAVRFLAFNPVLLVTSGLSRSDNPKWTNAVLIGAGNKPRCAASFGVLTASIFEKKWSKRKLGRALLCLPYASLRGIDLYSGYKLWPQD